MNSLDYPEFRADLQVKVQASVARCLRTPPEAAKPQDLSFGVVTALRSNGHRSTVVIGNCTVWADIGGTQPSKS